MLRSSSQNPSHPGWGRRAVVRASPHPSTPAGCLRHSRRRDHCAPASALVALATTRSAPMDSGADRAVSRRCCRQEADRRGGDRCPPAGAGPPRPAPGSSASRRVPHRQSRRHRTSRQRRPPHAPCNTQRCKVFHGITAHLVAAGRHHQHRTWPGRARNAAVIAAIPEPNASAAVASSNWASADSELKPTPGSRVAPYIWSSVPSSAER